MIGKPILTFILALVIFVTVPLILVLSSPLFLFRIFIAKFARICKPELGKMFTTRSTVYATDDIFTKPKMNISVLITLEGTVDIRLARETVQNRLFESRFPDGDLKYPELKQCRTSFAGYFFWKNDPNFDIRDHVRLHEKSSSDIKFSDEEIQDYWNELLHQKWSEGKPMWNMTFLHNSGHNGPTTVFFVTFHHSVGDGYSWLPLLVQQLCQTPVKIPIPNYVKRSKFLLLLIGLTLPFRAAYEIADNFLIPMTNPPFKVPKREETGNVHAKVGEEIKIKTIKEIKDFFGVSFTSVIFSVIGGAMRDLMISEGWDVPNKVPTVTAQPLPGHSEKLRNYLTAAKTNFRTGESDPISRLKLTHRDFENGKRSTFPIVFRYMLVILGSYFTCITRVISKNGVMTTGVTNFPGGDNTASFTTHKWRNIMFSSGLQRGCAGLAFCALSYVDGFRITSIADVAVLTKNDVSDLSDLIQKHVSILHQYSINNKV